MDEVIEELVELDITYMRERKGILELFKKRHHEYPEIATVVNNINDVRNTLNETLTGYARFDISHLSNIKSVKVATPEEAKRALEILKGSTQ
ncbi:hypothetical protein A3K64_02820 [Candidatus Micrarchaeota archaeon RBG_16_36_9]|nr:MAG: hypothetical protein A3K64_02820 [Candidatus Micrarchaeota archaeon RBG_16_36_9]